MAEVRVQFLGTGDPFANGGRLQACILLDGPGGRILLDCGATSLVAMERFGVDPGTIDAVVVTHFHGDHIGGLPFLIMESQFNDVRGDPVLPRARPLLIAGPPGTEARVRQVMGLFRYQAGFTAATDSGMLTFMPLEPGPATSVGIATVTAFAMRHTPEAVALRIDVAGKTIAYSGDTGWTDSLITVAAGADLFICQVYTFDIPIDSMLSYRVLLEHRSQLSCKRLILTHLGGEMQRRLAEVSDEVAEDGLQITV